MTAECNDVQRWNRWEEMAGERSLPCLPEVIEQKRNIIMTDLLVWNSDCLVALQPVWRSCAPPPSAICRCDAHPLLTGHQKLAAHDSQR